MVDHPKKPFHDAVHNIQPKQDQEKPAQLRDKDNAKPELKPNFSRRPAPNLAPKGMAGIKRNLPRSREPEKKGGITLAGSGDLTRAFKPIALGDKKDRGHER